jgi:hypothetical protein
MSQHGLFTSVDKNVVFILEFEIVTTTFKGMSRMKRKKTAWGGKRVGAGRPRGSGLKIKICVSVNKGNWQSATAKWKIRSHLVDRLLMDYVSNSGGVRDMGAL